MNDVILIRPPKIAKDLLACRGCLATDIKLHKIQQNELAKHFGILVETPIFMSDELPQYLCIYCASMVIKFAAFRERCKKTYNVLLNAKFQGTVINTLYAKTIDRKSHNLYFSYAQTFTQNIVCEPSLKHEFISNESIDNVGVKQESVIDTIAEQEYFAAENIEVKIENSEDPLINEECFKDDFISLQETKDNVETEGADADFHVDVAYNDSDFKSIDANIISLSDPVKASGNNEMKAGSIAGQSINTLKEKYAISDLDDVDKTIDAKDSVLQFLQKTGKNVKKNKTDIIKSKKICRKKTKTMLDWMYTTKNKEEIKQFEKENNVKVSYLTREQILQAFEDRKKSEEYLGVKFRCDICYTGFKHNDTLKNHQASHDPDSGDFVCEFCQCRFKSALRLKLHLKLHVLNISCNICGRVVRTYVKAKLHYGWHTGVTYFCNHCSKDIGGNSTYYQHLRTAHADKMSWCDKCGDTFVRDVGLNQHMKVAHGEVTQQDPNRHCSPCGTEFSTVEALRTHIDTSPDGFCDPSMRACFKCGSNFETRDLVRLHYLNTHKQNRRKRKERIKISPSKAYKQHLLGISHRMQRRVYECEKHIMCEICGMKFKALTHLRIHQRLHTDEKPYQCDVCTKRFRHIMTFKTHVYTHTGERPFECPSCPKKFKSYVALKRHMLVHTRVKTHKCPICDKTFQTSSNAKCHIKTVHLEMPPRNSRKKKQSK